MVKGCLSVLDSCDKLCDACIESHNRYQRHIEDEEIRAIERAHRLLVQHGYTVIGPKTKVVDNKE